MLLIFSSRMLSLKATWSLVLSSSCFCAIILFISSCLFSVSNSSFSSVLSSPSTPAFAFNENIFFSISFSLLDKLLIPASCCLLFRFSSFIFSCISFIFVRSCSFLVFIFVISFVHTSALESAFTISVFSSSISFLITSWSFSPFTSISSFILFISSLKLLI